MRSGVQDAGLPGSIPLYTRKGREISNVQDSDPAPTQVERVQSRSRRDYPRAIERRPPSGQYNCHGLTFANRRTCIRDPKDVAKVLEDDGFRGVRLSEVEPGDLVIYLDGSDISHSGIILEVVPGYPEGSMLRGLKVLSKWGSAGEYIHMATEGPYARETITYRTDRP